MTVTGFVVVVKDEPVPGVPSFRAYGPVVEGELANDVAAALRAKEMWAAAMPLRALSEIMLETRL